MIYRLFIEEGFVSPPRRPSALSWHARAREPSANKTNANDNSNDNNDDNNNNSNDASHNKQHTNNDICHITITIIYSSIGNNNTSATTTTTTTSSTTTSNHNTNKQ